MMGEEGKISISLGGWIPVGHPVFDKGKGTTSTEASRIQFQGQDKFAPNVTVSIPGGGHNIVRISYFEATSAGNSTAPTDLNLWSTGYDSGEYLATHYRFRNVKFSYDFVTWPYPVGSRRFRFKTLWQVQYVGLNSDFNNPLNTSPSPAAGSKTIVLPTLGLGITDYISQNLRIDVNASGFTIPHHSAIGDVEAAPALKLSRLEVRGGLKLFYFKSSPSADFYMKGRLAGAFVGLRFYLN